MEGNAAAGPTHRGNVNYRSFAGAHSVTLSVAAGIVLRTNGGFRTPDRGEKSDGHPDATGDDQGQSQNNTNQYRSSHHLPSIPLAPSE